MTDAEILKHIDHTLLKAVSSWTDIQKLCEEAIHYKTASVCIPPAYAARIRQSYQHRQLTICTVIGFPLGYQTTGTKIFEAKEAINSGADEVDMVINIGSVKNRDFKEITEEISAIKKTVGSKILKVIIETCYLTHEEKMSVCQCVTDGGADFIKTSTGFGTSGAVLEDIELFKKNIGPHVKIKAAGGIKSREDLENFIKAGCQRIGTSSAVALLTGSVTEGY
jgi:deoxyribose-phosphate aldolase